MSDLLSRLKRETSDCHITLEKALDLARPDMLRAEYIVLLKGFRGFVGPWERAIAAALPARLHGFAQEREKTALLDADLRYMGGEMGGEAGGDAEGARRDVAWVPFPLESIAQALGSMYVMEGSTLGGRIIGPAMAARFNLPEGLGYTYFDPYGAHTGSKWNAFKALAEAEISPQQHDIAVMAARDTFTALHQWLVPVPAAEHSS